MSVTLSLGNASDWTGPKVDLVFTHPYAPLPKELHGVPSIINLFERDGSRREKAEQWIGAKLTMLGRWGDGAYNTIYISGLPMMTFELGYLRTDHAGPGKGWMPLELPRRLLTAYANCIPSNAVIFDGFMGRGTIGKAAREMGYDYIGVDIDPSRLALAREYLKEDPHPC